MTDQPEISEMVLLIKRSIAFADWAAGEGICPVGYGDPEAVSRNPDEFLFAYSQETGDEEWSTLADRITGAFEEKFAEIAVLREALRSIAANTCCDRCQEAALVASAGLAKAGAA